MKIVVLVKQVPDTWGERKLTKATGRLDRTAGDAVIDEINERALEVALRHKDAQDAEVIALAMGPAGVTDALRKSLAMGADSALHVQDQALFGADLSHTAAVLAAAITKSGFHLVIAGNESTDGRGGVIPAMIAEHLGVPSLTFLDSVTITDGGVSGIRADEHGTVDVHASLPAVLSITEASADPRFPNFRGIMKAKKKQLTTWSLADLGLDESGIASSTVVVSTTERPARTAGTKNVDTGNGGNEIADFLTAARLI